MSAAPTTKFMPRKPDDLPKIAEEREHLARADKSIALADMLQGKGMTSIMAAVLNDQGWRAAAMLAGVRLTTTRTRKLPHVSRPTRSAVVAILADRERRADRLAELRTVPMPKRPF